MSRASPDHDDVDPRIRHIEYRCTVCGRAGGRGDLTVKQVVFMTSSKPRLNLRQRTIAWLCDTCRDQDPEWNLPAWAKSPGMSNTRLGSTASTQDAPKGRD